MHPLVALMRRYAVDYTARGDVSVCRDIMIDDYALHMGVHHITGRDGPYLSAVQAQLDQFPTLGFTVHQILTNGDRLALRFSEHGASIRHDGRQAAWPGISTYRWDGERLTECWVEQDYFARTRQLATDRPDDVEPPAVDPWATAPVPVDSDTDAAARTWLEKGDLTDAGDVRLDDGEARVAIDVAATEVDDLFSAGRQAAFHITQRGRYAGGLPALEDRVGTEIVLGVAGVVEVVDGSVAAVRAVTDRLGVSRQLTGGGR